MTEKKQLIKPDLYALSGFYVLRGHHYALYGHLFSYGPLYYGLLEDTRLSFKENNVVMGFGSLDNHIDLIFEPKNDMYTYMDLAYSTSKEYLMGSYFLVDDIAGFVHVSVTDNISVSEQEKLKELFEQKEELIKKFKDVA